MKRTQLPDLTAFLVAGALGAFFGGVRQAEAAEPTQKGAAADRQPNAAAAEFDKLGKAAYKKQEWDDAIAAFEGAYEADPLPRFLFNVGRCHEKRGELARASQYFERYLEQAPDAKDRPQVEALAKMLRIKLKKSFSKLVVVTDHEDALVQVFVTDNPINGVSPFSYWVPFGKYRVVVEKVGFQNWEGEVVLTPNKLSKVMVQMEPEVAAQEPASAVPAAAPPPETAPASAAVAPTPPEPSTTENPPAGATAWLAPATVGLGGALLAAGGVLGWLSSQAVEDRDALVDRSWDYDIAYSDYRGHDDSARGHALVANVLVGAGAVAAVSGVVMWWTAGDDADEAGGHWAVAPTPAGVALLWSEVLP